MKSVVEQIDGCSIHATNRCMGSVLYHIGQEVDDAFDGLLSYDHIDVVGHELAALMSRGIGRGLWQHIQEQVLLSC